MNPETSVARRGRIAAAVVLTLVSVVAATAQAAPLFRTPYLLVPMGRSPASVAVGDVSGDGRLDIVCGRGEVNASDSRISVALASSDGWFDPAVDYQAAGDPTAVALADFDEDGIEDVASCTNNGFLTVLFGNTAGVLGRRLDLAVGSSPQSLAVGDVDGDGHADAVVASRSFAAGSVCILYGNGDGTFRPRVDVPTAREPSVALGDMDGDGWLDLVVPSGYDSMIHLILNRGDSFEESSSTTLMGWGLESPVVGDFDRDGRYDVAVARLDGYVSVAYGDGTGGIAAIVTVPTNQYNGALASADLDGDGYLDLLVNQGPNGTVTTLHGGPGRAFEPWHPVDASGSAASIAIADRDADGHLDLFLAERQADCVSVHHGNGDGTFGPDYAAATPAPVAYIAAARDVNRDGNMDLVTGGGDMGAGIAFLPGDGRGGLGIPMIVPLASVPWAVGFGDMDRDGSEDLVVAMQAAAQFSVLNGRPGGGFDPPADIPAPSGIGSIAVDDMNRDGAPDVVFGIGYYSYVCFFAAGTARLGGVAAAETGVAIATNQGDGLAFSFGPQVSSVFSPVVATADFDRDGFPDIAVGDLRSYLRGTIQVYFGDAAGGYSRSVLLSDSVDPQALATGDVDGDGNPDLVAAIFSPCGSPSWLSVFRSNGDGTFRAEERYPVARGAIMPAIADVDGDGTPDLVAASGPAHAVTVLLGAGDGTFGHRMDYGVGFAAFALAVSDFDHDGAPDLAVTGLGSPSAALFLHVPPGGPPFPARAFVRGEHRAVPLAPGVTLDVRIEPVGDAFQNSDIDPASIRMATSSAPDAPSVAAAPAERIVETDEDRNGVPEIGATFAGTTLRTIYPDLHGRVEVTAEIRGTLTGGGRFAAPLRLTLVGTGAPGRGAMTPNPLNPSGALAFELSRAGRVTIRIFDVGGRQVRRLVDRTFEAGSHVVRFDGRDGAGRDLPSGVYYFRVEKRDGAERGRFVVLR